MTQPSTKDDDDQAPGARAVLRVLGVLGELAAHPAGLSLVELAARLDVPKASLHRILKTLRQAGYLALDAGRFRIGPQTAALVRMIGDVAPPIPFPRCLDPVLDWLAQETGETVMLGVADMDHGEVEYVAAVQSAQPIRFGIQIGDRRPLYSAASGQVLLAWLSPEQQRDYLTQTDFVAFTPATCDGERLVELIPTIRASGLAVDIDGRVLGASGLASPVFDASGTICAAISVAGPTARIMQLRSQLGDQCLRAGERASRIMGLRGTYPV